MPINAAPNRGYTDWQRVQNYDSGTLYTVTVVHSAATQTSTILDVSRYGYIGGSLFCDQNQVICTLTWFIDAAGANVVGQRQFVLSNNVLHPARIRLPNLGPFFQIQLLAIAGALYDGVFTIFGTNRLHPLEFIPVNQVVIDQQTVSIVNGPTPYYPTDYYAGPMRVWMSVPVSSVTLSLQALSTTNTWDYVDQTAAIAAATVLSLVMIAPPGAWRLLASNSGATTAGFYLSATPSMSGAA